MHIQAILTTFAVLSLGAGPTTTTDKKPVQPATPAQPAGTTNPQDTFEDEPVDTVKKTDATTAVVQKNGAKVLVLPFAPIYRSVTQAKIQTANDLLLKELDQKDLQVIRGGVSKGETGPGPSLEAAQKATAEALKAESDRDIARAISLRKAAISDMEKNAAAVDPDDYVAAHHYLARALMWSGDDKASGEVIEQAVRMRPGFSLEPAEFSRLYRKWTAKAAEKAIAEKPADLMVRSALPGAVITLDGRAMDTAPVLLKKVVPGKHLIGAKIEGVPAFAAIVEVKAAGKNEFTAIFSNTMGGAAVGTVADAIAENAIPKKAVEAAAAAGKEAGAAFVVLGALAKDDDRFHVHAYVVEVGKATIKPLDVVDYDLDMLTAESDVLRVVQNISSTVGGYSSSESSVSLIEKRIAKQPTTNEVAAAPSLADEGATAKKGPTDAAAKKRTVFQPLKGGKVEIKDEKDE